MSALIADEVDLLLAHDPPSSDMLNIIESISKTEGNGGVNDFTRGYFTQSLMALLSGHLGEPADCLPKRIPCVLSGGTEDVLSPHDR